MSQRGTPTTSAIAVTAAVLATVVFGADQKAKPAASKDVVATLGDRSITESELEELAKDRLMRLRSEEYQIKKQVLEEYITRALLEREA